MARTGIVDAILGVNESTDSIVVTGQCDIIISGLTSGSVKLQYKLSPTPVLTSPQWTDFPEGTFSEDSYKTIFISEDRVRMRLTGSSNNSGVYVRLARFLVR